MDFYINNIKTTFCSYPKFGRLLEENNKPLFENIKIADIDTLIAMKADALKSREKIRDYYDLYAISKEFGFKKIITESLKADHNFNIKLFIKRLVEMDDKLRDIYIEDHLKPKYNIDKVSIRFYFEKEADNYFAKGYISHQIDQKQTLKPEAKESAKDVFTLEFERRTNDKGGWKR